MYDLVAGGLYHIGADGEYKAAGRLASAPLDRCPFCLSAREFSIWYNRIHYKCGTVVFPAFGEIGRFTLSDVCIGRQVTMPDDEDVI